MSPIFEGFPGLENARKKETQDFTPKTLQFKLNQLKEIRSNITSVIFHVSTKVVFWSSAKGGYSTAGLSQSTFSWKSPGAEADTFTGANEVEKTAFLRY